MLNRNVLNQILEATTDKVAFVPPGPGAMPPDPMAGGGMPMDPAMMGGAMPPDPMAGGMPMDPAMLGGAMPPDPMAGGMMPPGPAPEDVGALAGEAPAPETIGNMSTDDFKMFLAETMSEVQQGGAEAGPVEDPRIGELEAQVAEMEEIVAGLTGDKGIVPEDAPVMDGPGAIEPIEDIAPIEELAPPIAPMPKIASEDSDKAQLLNSLRLLNGTL